MTLARALVVVALLAAPAAAEPPLARGAGWLELDPQLRPRLALLDAAAPGAARLALDGDAIAAIVATVGHPSPSRRLHLSPARLSLAATAARGTAPPDRPRPRAR